jgi:hypothetical protein
LILFSIGCEKNYLLGVLLTPKVKGMLKIISPFHLLLSPSYHGVGLTTGLLHHKDSWVKKIDPEVGKNLKLANTFLNLS